MSQQPPIVTGPDGLPHCGWCLSEHVLCDKHREHVTTALNTLKSANVFASAQSDIRYVIRHKDRYQERDDA